MIELVAHSSQLSNLCGDWEATWSARRYTTCKPLSIGLCTNRLEPWTSRSSRVGLPVPTQTRHHKLWNVSCLNGNTKRAQRIQVTVLIRARYIVWLCAHCEACYAKNTDLTHSNSATLGLLCDA